MSPDILHVEDEPGLTRLVEAAFRKLGFRGQIRNAASLGEALTALDAFRAEGRLPRLILTDLRLPDGFGFDLIRTVREDPELAAIPVVVLSGDASPDTVSRAYALGANAFVPKIPADGDVFEAVESLYRCWLTQTLLPEPPARDRAGWALSRAISLESRCAQIYTELARRFLDDPPMLRLWLDMALAEGNHANLLAFFEGLTGPEDYDETFLDGLGALLTQVEACVAGVEAELRAASRVTRDQALDWSLRVERCPSDQLVATGLSALGTRSPEAVAALVENVAEHIDRLVGAVRELTTRPDLLARASEVEARSRAMTTAAPQGVPLGSRCPRPC